MLLILNDVSGSEIFLILFFVLIFFGAKSIPGLARTLGRTVRQIKDASADLQKEIRKSGDDMKKDLNLKGILEDTAREVTQPLDQQIHEIENTVKYERPRIHSQIPVLPPKNVENVEIVEKSRIADSSIDDLNNEKVKPGVKKKQTASKKRASTKNKSNPT